MLLCPFSTDLNSFPGECPQWAPDAYLYVEMDPLFINTNVFDEDRRGSVCKNNNIGLSVNNPSFPDMLHVYSFGASRGGGGGPAPRKAIVKNIAKPRYKRANGVSEPTGPENECKSWTPPNVRCVYFDQKDFVEVSQLMNLQPICNPMVESKANTLDSLRLTLQRDQTDASYRAVRYTYQGLIPQPSASKFLPVPNDYLFKTAPSTLSVSSAELGAQGAAAKGSPYFRIHLNMSLFSGVVAVFYDPEKGAPTELDFDGVRMNKMSDSILGSTVLLETNCYSTPSTCSQTMRDPQDAFVTARRTQNYVNAIREERKNATSLKMNIQPSTLNQKSLDTFAQFATLGSTYDLSISFSSTESIVEKQFVSLTILTTVSIVLSTAASLWGARAKIKDGINMVTSKIKCLHKPPEAKYDGTRSVPMTRIDVA
jgi:hypothetical protein